MADKFVTHFGSPEIIFYPGTDQTEAFHVLSQSLQKYKG